MKKTSKSGVALIHKIRTCSESANDNLCENIDKMVNRRKENSANLEDIKRHPPNEFGYMLSLYRIS